MLMLNERRRKRLRGDVYSILREAGIRGQDLEEKTAGIMALILDEPSPSPRKVRPVTEQEQVGAGNLEAEIVSLLGRLPGRRARRGAIVEALAGKGFGARTVDRALQRLTEAAALRRLNQGVYALTDPEA